jgi:hypothetical protein
MLFQALEQEPTQKKPGQLAPTGLSLEIRPVSGQRSGRGKWDRMLFQLGYRNRVSIALIAADGRLRGPTGNPHQDPALS